MILREIIINSVTMFVFFYMVNFTILAILNDIKENEESNEESNEELNMHIVDENSDENGDENVELDNHV